VNATQPVITHWTLGGGTAMMLRIDHRESHDIDIFLPDPQMLAFLDPQKRDFQFEVQPDASDSDGVQSRKFVFNGIGEIDFIVARGLTSSPSTQTVIEGEPALLETIPEIITKKIYYRGSSIRPRDIFDIAAAGERHADSVIAELRSYRKQVGQALAAIDRLNADFVGRAIAQLAIKEPYKAIAKRALEKGRQLLCAVSGK
jgi:hypothetical protein